MGASKTIGEVAAMLEPHGFRLEGVNGNNHYIFREPETGAIARIGTAAIVSRKHRANVVNQAARSKRHAQSASHRWVNWLLEQFDIGEAEEREVAFPVMVMADRFLAEHPDIRGTSKGLWLIALKNSHLATEVESAHKGMVGDRAISKWRLHGPLFGVKPVPEVARASRKEEDPAITEARAALAGGVAERQNRQLGDALTGTTTQTDEGDVREPAVSEPRAELAAVHSDPAAELEQAADGGGGTEVAAGGTEGADAVEGGDDEAPVVGAGSRTARPGPVSGIPADLAEALSEHFSGDLRAENELLRSALEQSLDALLGATQTLHDALALTNERRAEATRKTRGMGPKNLRRWELMQAHRTELDGPLTAEKLEHFFVAHGEPMANRAIAGNVLWTLMHNGLLVRADTAGVYLWP